MSQDLAHEIDIAMKAPEMLAKVNAELLDRLRRAGKCITGLKRDIAALQEGQVAETDQPSDTPAEAALLDTSQFIQQITQISGLEASLIDKDNEIATLKQRLQEEQDASALKFKEFTDRISDLSKDTTWKQKQIERLTAALKASSSGGLSQDDIESSLVKTSSHIAGLEAQIREMKTAHPDSPLLQPTEEEGTLKTPLRRIYEAAASEKTQEAAAQPETEPAAKAQ